MVKSPVNGILHLVQESFEWETIALGSSSVVVLVAGRVSGSLGALSIELLQEILASVWVMGLLNCCDSYTHQ